MQKVCSKLKLIFPRLVRQQHTRDTLVQVKSQSKQIGEINETLDNLCRLITRHQHATSEIYAIELQMYALANQLKSVEASARADLERKVFDLFWSVQKLLHAVTAISLSQQEVKGFASLISGVRDFSGVALS